MNTSGKSGLHFETKYLEGGRTAAILPRVEAKGQLRVGKGKNGFIPEVGNESCCFSGN